MLQHAVWTQAGNLTTRAATPGYPRWLLEAPLWTIGGVWKGEWSAATLNESITLAAELGTPIGFHWCVNQPPELHVTVDFTTFIYVFSSQEGCFGIRVYFLAQFMN